MSRIVNVGLCEARHEMPVKDFIWSLIEAPMDFDGLTNHARQWIGQQDFEDHDYSAVNVYVTGLTTALTSFLIAWDNNKARIPSRPTLSLLHFDRDTNSYKTQIWG